MLSYTPETAYKICLLTDHIEVTAAETLTDTEAVLIELLTGVETVTAAAETVGTDTAVGRETNKCQYLLTQHVLCTQYTVLQALSTLTPVTINNRQAAY